MTGEGLQVLGRADLAIEGTPDLLRGHRRGRKGAFLCQKGASPGWRGAVFTKNGAIMGEKGACSYQNDAFTSGKAPI